jgi:hypothetical protein
VKRLVRLFPHVKEEIKDKLSTPQIRNRVCEYETQRYFERICLNVLDFKPDALNVTEFLTTDQQIWQLQMIDGDVWAGINKVYWVLQNTSCTPNYNSEGHCTILDLERLLTVHQVINVDAYWSQQKHHIY